MLNKFLLLLHHLLRLLPPLASPTRPTLLLLYQSLGALYQLPILFLLCRSFFFTLVTCVCVFPTPASCASPSLAAITWPHLLLGWYEYVQHVTSTKRDLPFSCLEFLYTAKYIQKETPKQVIPMERDFSWSAAGVSFAWHVISCHPQPTASTAAHPSRGAIILSLWTGEETSCSSVHVERVSNAILPVAGKLERERMLRWMSVVDG